MAKHRNAAQMMPGHVETESGAEEFDTIASKLAAGKVRFPQKSSRRFIP